MHYSNTDLEHIRDDIDSFLSTARQIAVRLIHEYGSVTTEDVRQECLRRNIQPKYSSQWSNVLRSEEFEYTGRMIYSHQQRKHVVLRREWKLSGILKLVT